MFCSGKLLYASFYLWRYFSCSATCKEDQKGCDGKSAILSVVQSSFRNDCDPQLLLKTCPQLLFALLLLRRRSDREQRFGSTVSFRKHCLLFLSPALVTCSHPSDVPGRCQESLQGTVPRSVTPCSPAPPRSVPSTGSCAGTRQRAARRREWAAGSKRGGGADSYGALLPKV